MNPDDPFDAHAIVHAYTAALEHRYQANLPFPQPHSALPHPKETIRRSMRTTVAVLAAAGDMTPELKSVLEIAYTSLADYLDPELVQVMREYDDALAQLNAGTERGREKAGTKAWSRVAESSSLVGRIARGMAEEADRLRAEFREFAAQTPVTHM